MTRSAYKIEGLFEEQERDVKKYWKSGQIRLAVFGLENQTGEESPYSITLEHLKHVEEFAELMNAITNSDRFSEIPKIVNERGDKSVYTLLFDEREAKGIVKGAIRIYHEDLNLSPKEIIQKIIQKFSLPEADAVSYVESTLGLDSGSVKPVMSEGTAPGYTPGAPNT